MRQLSCCALRKAAQALAAVPQNLMYHNTRAYGMRPQSSCSSAVTITDTVQVSWAQMHARDDWSLSGACLHAMCFCRSGLRLHQLLRHDAGKVTTLLPCRRHPHMPPCLQHSCCKVARAAAAAATMHTSIQHLHNGTAESTVGCGEDEFGSP
jgi:hypothetical protein